jgi:hypothetical protein
VDIGTRMGGAPLSLDGSAIRIEQMRVSFCCSDGHAWRLGVALEGIRPDDQRTVRRWLSKAECRARVTA